MSSDKIPSHEERFKANVVGLGDLILDIVTEVNDKEHFVVDPVVVNLAVRVLERISGKAIISTFINKSNTNADGKVFSMEEHCWSKIRSRDRSFFVENAGEIFSGLPVERVDAFSKMFSAVDENGKPVVPEEDEQEIWEYFESFVKISIKYIHENRKPVAIRTGTEELRKYENESFFVDVNLLDHADSWGITLNF